MYRLVAPTGGIFLVEHPQSFNKKMKSPGFVAEITGEFTPDYVGEYDAINNAKKSLSNLGFKHVGAFTGQSLTREEYLRERYKNPTLTLQKGFEWIMRPKRELAVWGVK